RALARERGLVALDLGDLVAHRRRVEPRVVRDCEAELPLLAGTFTALGCRDRVDGTEHMALTVGDVAGAEAPLVALHAECVAGDVFRASRCDCGELLERSLGLIAAEGRGAIVHVRRQWGGRSCPRAGL